MVNVKSNRNDISAAHLRTSIAELEAILGIIETNDIACGQDFDERLAKVSGALCVLKRILQERRFR